MLNPPTNPESLVIRPAGSLLVALAIPLAPGIVLGGLTWIYRDGVVAGSFLFVGALTIWLSVATIRIIVRDGIVSKCQFFFTRWSIAISDVSLSTGRTGDIPIMPALIFSNRKTGKVVGSILIAQFRKRDIQLLRDAIGE